MQEPELGAGIDAEFAGQDAPHVLIGGEGVGRPAAAVQTQHQLRVELLLQRMSRDQLAQFRHDLTVPAQVQIGVNPRDQRLQPLVLDGGSLAVPQQLRGHVGERVASPQPERLPQQAVTVERARRRRRVHRRWRALAAVIPWMGALGVSMLYPEAGTRLNSRSARSTRE